MSKKIGMIALGCAKNRVDAEVLLGMLEKHGYEICPDLAECDACIVHTCTFIGPAKEESIGAILDAAEYKTKGKLKKNHSNGLYGGTLSRRDNREYARGRCLPRFKIF